jgi:excisionase family DNA binding protein
MAAYIRKTEHAIYKMVERGQIPCVKLGQALRFDPAAIQAWIHEHSIPATEPPSFVRCSRRDGRV